MFCKKALSSVVFTAQKFSLKFTHLNCFYFLLTIFQVTTQLDAKISRLMDVKESQSPWVRRCQSSGDNAQTVHTFPWAEIPPTSNKTCECLLPLKTVTGPGSDFKEIPKLDIKPLSHIFESPLALIQQSKTVFMFWEFPRSVINVHQIKYCQLWQLQPSLYGFMSKTTINHSKEDVILILFYFCQW